MTQTIAFAGKGGTGKTSICGVVVDYLVRAGKTPVLAVDADANSNLNEVLGVEVDKTLGEIREIIAHAELATESPIPSGMSKQDYAEYQFSSALMELDDFDLLVMGRTQGQGCYCYVNGVLKNQIDKYAKNYNYVVVDNEAGLEHISRGVLPKVDVMLLVSDCSRRGIQAAGRLQTMIGELGLKPAQLKLIVNRAPAADGAAVVETDVAGAGIAAGADAAPAGAGVAAGADAAPAAEPAAEAVTAPAFAAPLEAGIVEEIAAQGLSLAGVVPTDEAVYRFDAQGKPTVTLPESTPFKQAVYAILKELGI
ncbi:MAG: AAA family ATPase [Coriobacteriales bacterium]|jgi:CO dehydrogenase maturation factor|nr:AAA family ATPase [Coriobacteriales bacterium]